VLVLAFGGRAFADGAEFFEQKIRPILVERCYKCHSREAEKLKGGLLLDSRAGVLKGGENGPVIVPGDPDRSTLIKAVRYTDPDLQMPPKNQKLPDQQIADLEAWVKMGTPIRVTTKPHRQRNLTQRNNIGLFTPSASQPSRV
jgi:mono/diheme cytochrome c family protein